MGTSSIRCAPYFLGHWLVPIVTLTLMGITTISLFSQRVPSYPSDDLVIPFDKSKVPFFTALMADLHHTQIRPERTAIMEEQLGNLTRKFNPPVISIAGDLVDALNSTNELSFHRQYEVNWKRYNGTRAITGLFDEGRIVLESAGNHDMMVVAADTPELNRYRYYTMTPNAKFGVRAYNFNDCSVPVNLILYNPLRPPFTSGPMGVFPCHFPDDVDALNSMIRRDAKNVIVTHFPVTHVWSLGTTSDTDARQVVLKSDLYLSGHVHPETAEISRKKNTLSVIVSAFFESPKIIMGYVDNGGVGAQVVDTHEDNAVLVTYPLPKSQLTARSVFNLRQFPIRAFSFSDKPIYLTVYIDDCYFGVMEFQKTIRRNVHFYTLDVNVSTGTHQLKVGTYEMTFLVGDASEPATESVNRLYSCYVCLISPAVFVFMIASMFVPWWKIQAIGEMVEDFRKYMYGEEDATELTWYEMVFIAIPYWWSRLRRLPSAAFWVSVANIVWYLFIPFYGMWVDDNLAIAWIWGVRLCGAFTQYAMMFVMLIIYIFIFLFWALQLLGHWYENTNKWEWYQWLEFSIYWLPMLGAFIGWSVLAYLAGGWFTILTSPCTWCEIATAAFYIYTFVKESKRNRIVIDENIMQL